MPVDTEIYEEEQLISNQYFYLHKLYNKLSKYKNDIEGFCEYVSQIPQIHATFFYFHTPYYDYDDLYLDKDTRDKVLLELKKKYKILNSKAGLKSAIRNDWKKNLDICQVYEGGEYYRCCRENKMVVCKDCGYLSYAEIDQTIKLKPGAIRNAMEYF